MSFDETKIDILSQETMYKIRFPKESLRKYRGCLGSEEWYYLPQTLEEGLTLYIFSCPDYVRRVYHTKKYEQISTFCLKRLKTDMMSVRPSGYLGMYPVEYSEVDEKYLREYCKIPDEHKDEDLFLIKVITFEGSSILEGCDRCY